MRRALAFLLVALALRPALAQCPDGTPPPCAGQRPGPRLPSVVVLFMEPRSRNAADSLLAEGLTLEIINTLSSVRRLDVRSRWDSRHVAAAADPIGSARALGVDYLVDGVLEVDSARVLLRGAITRTSTRRVVRPIGIERPRSEIEGFQVAVARDVAGAVVGQLLPAERARFAVRRVNPRLTELLLSARALRLQYTAPAIRQALVLATQAVTVDSTYAPAWVELANCHVVLLDFEPDSSDRLLLRGLVEAERALALDSSSTSAMSRLASIRALRNDLSPLTEALARRGAAGERGLESGMALARVLAHMGRVDEGLAVVRETARRDSLSPLIWMNAASRFSSARHFAEAAAAVERALALRPSAEDSARLGELRRWAKLEARDCGGALADGQAAADRQLVVESLRCLGRGSEADSVVVGELARPDLAPTARAIFLAWHSEPDSAFAVLDRAYPRALGNWLQHPAFDPYQQHPAYLALRRRMGLEN